MELLDLLRRMHDVLGGLGVRHAVVGSMASMLYGEPRMTRDIDIVIDLPAHQVAEFCDQFPPPDYYVSKPAAAQAVKERGQFNIIHIPSGNKVDLMLCKMHGWGRSQLDRVRQIAVCSGVTVNVAAPEDVILGKLQYYHEGASDKHLRDIVAMLDISGGLIDREYIQRWTIELNVTEEWRAVLDRLKRPSQNS